MSAAKCSSTFFLGMIFLTSVDKGNPSMKFTSLYDKEAYELEVVQSVD